MEEPTTPLTAAPAEAPAGPAESPPPPQLAGTVPPDAAPAAAPVVEDGAPVQAASAPEEPTAAVPLAELRALVLRAYPDAVPELVSGDTLAALVESAERSAALRARLLAEAQAVRPPVSAGAPRRAPEAEVARLSPFEKIARAIAGRGS